MKKKVTVSKLAPSAPLMPEGYIELRYNHGDEEARSRLKTIQKADEMAHALDEIYRLARGLLKHNDEGLSASQTETIEQIKSYAGEFCDL